MTNKGKVFLIPNVISENTQDNVIPVHVRNALPGIRNFLVEDLRTARRFLSSLKIFDSIETLHFDVLNKDTTVSELPEMLKPLEDGFNIGIISESGCPGVADPGAMAVKYAHEKHFQVVPLVGPSSLLLALMASGLNGQKFAFHGYLPIDSKTLAKTLKRLEDESSKEQQTQILIETPYRNNQLFRNLMMSLRAETLLCVAFDITGQDELIATKRITEWRSQSFEMPKKPAIFLFLAP